MRCFLMSIGFCSLLLASACGSKSDEQPLIPYAPVNLSLNLTNQEYVKLRSPNGAVTLPVSGPAGSGGVKGVIVVHPSGSSTYLAFERNCPYQPFNACARVSLDRNSQLFMQDSCCQSQFNLQGQVIGGPTSRPLKQYNTSVQGSILSITN